jgi:predicted N-acetyltransferase YhbS
LEPGDVILFGSCKNFNFVLDTVFVVKEHRNGVGKKLVQFVLEELNRRGVKRLLVSAMTDLRVAKLWGRMGFKEAATQMIYRF